MGLGTMGFITSLHERSGRWLRLVNSRGLWKCKKDERIIYHTDNYQQSGKTFETSTKFTVKYKHVQATVEVKRNILGSLLAFSISKERAIDLLAALDYPLSLIALSLATVDGNRRETSKSKLITLLVDKVALKDPKTDKAVKEIKKYATFVIDLVRAIQVMTNLQSTSTMWNLFGTLSQHYRRVSSGWILFQIHIEPTQSKVEKERTPAWVKELSLHLLSQDSHMTLLNSWRMEKTRPG